MIDEDAIDGPCARCGRAHVTHWGKASCTAHRSQRDETGSLVPCAGPRIRGLKVCQTHGGKSKRARAAAAKAQAREADRKAVEKAARIFGVPRQIDPVQGLIESYWRSAGLVEAYERMAAHLTAEDLGFGVITETTKETTTAFPDGLAVPDGYEAPREIETRTTRGVRKNIYVKLLDEERDRFERLGAEIVRLELEVRRDEYIRTQVDTFARVLGMLNLSDEQRRTAARLLRDLDGRPRVTEGRVIDGGASA